MSTDFSVTATIYVTFSYFTINFWNFYSIQLHKKNYSMDDELIVSFVKEHPFLYNNRIREYKNKEKKDRTWNKIALTLGYDVFDLKRRWKVLRDRFVRRLRTCDSEELFSKLPHYAQMSFLTNHVSHRIFRKKTSSLEEFDGSSKLENIFLHDGSSDEDSITYAGSADTEPSLKFKKSYSDEEDEIEAVNIEEGFLHQHSSDDVSDRCSESVNTEPSPKKRKNYSDVKFLSYSDITRKKLNKSRPVSDDAHFLLSLRSSLSQISDDRKKICLKGEILNVVQGYLE